MALFRWRGNGAGNKFDWDDGRNWDDETGTPYAAARYPGSVASTYDDVVFDEALGALADDPAGYDAVGAGDEMLRSFLVMPNYGKGLSAVNGDIGTNAAAPIDIEIAHDTDAQTEDSEVIIEGQNCGDIFLCGGGTDGLLRVTVLHMKSGSVLALDEKIGTLRVLKGAVELDAGAIIATELTIGFINSQTTDATVTIENATAIPVTVNCFGGQTTCYRDVTNLYIRGGIWTQGLDSTGNYGNITYLHMSGNSPNVVWNYGNVITGDIYAGVLNGSNPCALGREFTALKVHPGGKVDLSDDLQNNTVAEGGYILYLGGEVDFGLGQKLLPIP